MSLSPTRSLHIVDSERSPTFSDDEEIDDDQGGDYTTRMEALLSDDDEHGVAVVGEEEGGFVYDGVDADQITGDNYHDRLRDVLGPDDSYHESEEQELEPFLEGNDGVRSDEPRHNVPRVDIQPDTGAPMSDALTMTSISPDRVISPAPTDSFAPFPKPFLHPNVSRLRSFTPRGSPAPSAGSPTQAMTALSPSLSHFSDVSRTSSPTVGLTGLPIGHEREVFRWSSLRNAGSYLYNRRPLKASNTLGDPVMGTPMVLAANGFICIGTDKGRVFVFDFKQTLKCICGSDSTASVVGPVSSVALSNDHTFVASGHTTGYIQLFDLKNPQVAARTVIPVSFAAITSGRQEGHLPGSRIISISFVAGRHTAVVTADDHGLSFYHSLGKVLFVEASDTIRIFGNYHGEDTPEASISGHPAAPLPQQNTLDHLSLRRRKRTRNTVLAMSTLPLGPIPHPTDLYQIVALLTPTKLVIVGLKPTPKTWLKLMRDEQQLSSGAGHRRRGCLAWFPSVQDSSAEKVASVKNAKNGKQLQRTPTHPILSYSWGSRVYLLRVHEQKAKQTVLNSRTGRTSEIEVGTLVFEEAEKWIMDDAVLTIQWLNPNQLAIFTASTLCVYDVRGVTMVETVQFDSSSLVSPSLGYIGNGSISYSESVKDVAHSIRAYKGKLFLLGRQELFVGTLLSWADRILSFVEQGDFLSAIELTRTYYTGEAPGNRNGLPEDPEERQTIIGAKIHDLMVASSRYAFSEARMTDGTHTSLDGRGVDRTSLFEDLVATCARACITVGDFDFLFEELFQHYEDAGIHRMFLRQLEPFVLDGSISLVPPRVTQRLVALHDEDGRPDLAERIIWHIDPSCLDINQAITLCRTHQLWDALVYVYTRALRDYISPIVEFLGLIRTIQRDHMPTDTVIKNAYKIYAYLTTVLCGQIYPSQEPMEMDEALLAKRDAYSFIFCGHSMTWPAEGGSLVLTSQEESTEPTYPYVRFLLRFDAESFLHCLDLAFEDTYLNESFHGTSRLMIVTILLDVLSSGDLSPSDTTFINIFIARNVPKYPQFIQVGPSVLGNILIALASEPDVETREDRQLAAEYLLSAYTPHDGHRLLQLFEDAGFYRILRSWYRHEQQWGPLLTAFLHDHELRPSELFSGLEEVIGSSIKDNKKQVPGDVVDVLAASLSELLHVDMLAAAALIDKHVPQLHEAALGTPTMVDDRDQFIYLGHLVHGNEHDQYPPIVESPSRISSQLRHRFIRLQCRFAPSGIIDVLKHLQDDIDWPTVLSICEEAGAYDAVIWGVNYRGKPREALSKAEAFEKQLTLDLARTLASQALGSTASVYKCLNDLQSISRRGTLICMEHSSLSASANLPLEDIWYQLLHSQIHTVQTLSGCCSTVKGGDTGLEGEVLSTLRGIVQETFASLVSVSSTQAVSFPRLFKRLVDPVIHSSTTGTPYTEFRAILTGMLESYRTDGDMLIISKHLIDRDVFDFVELYAKEKMRGWAPSCGVCSSCGQTLLVSQADVESVQIRLSQTGNIYHLRCLPSDL